MTPGEQRKSRTSKASGPKSRASANRPDGASRPSRNETGRREGQRPQGSGARGPSAGRGRRDEALRRPERRSGGAKLTAAATTAIKAGHPWVFRDALSRPGMEVEAGGLLAVADPDGYRLGWGLFDPDGTVAVRLLSHDPNFTWDRDEIVRRYSAARSRRVAWMSAGLIPETHRLVHGEADGFPGLAIDRLGDALLIYKYARCAESYLDDLIEIIMNDEPPRSLYMQDRVRPVQPNERRPPAFHMGGEVAPPESTVLEDGLSYVVDVTAPVSPGLFLDLREGRRIMEQRVRGAKVLNLFSFTGAFATRAIRGGAESVTNVDAAARSHARCRQNLAANDMDPEACEALSGDVFKFLGRFAQRQRSFDFVVVDPPPFSNVDGKRFSALRDWSDLARDICPVVAPGGYMLAVCNASGLSDLDFLSALGRGCLSARRDVRLVGEWGLPADFPVLPAFQEGRYLKIKLLQLG